MEEEKGNPFPQLSIGDVRYPSPIGNKKFDQLNSKSVRNSMDLSGRIHFQNSSQQADPRFSDIQIKSTKSSSNQSSQFDLKEFNIKDISKQGNEKKYMKELQLAYHKKPHNNCIHLAFLIKKVSKEQSSKESQLNIKILRNLMEEKSYSKGILPILMAYQQICCIICLYHNQYFQLDLHDDQTLKVFDNSVLLIGSLSSVSYHGDYLQKDRMFYEDDVISKIVEDITNAICQLNLILENATLHQDLIQSLLQNTNQLVADSFVDSNQQTIPYKLSLLSKIRDNFSKAIFENFSILSNISNLIQTDSEIFQFFYILLFGNLRLTIKQGHKIFVFESGLEKDSEYCHKQGNIIDNYLNIELRPDQDKIFQNYQEVLTALAVTFEVFKNLIEE
ncbi:UNKNOWN [Stylonychia lemnae]|uniref:Uncharacterized protein n=1 Tax=Stylonychia lemnae TaxID=5949 RepID=A0A078AVI3_STYLE|nr:UNKNOWN [Stylonychia lemnae]|eukprot:CDW84838.1 UNKNOWN [Stylonychia lemnae]